jgi:chromosome partitioning protein
MGKIISIVNQKGGVGKTTTAVNLSACLAQRGKKTLLIDLDPQANATSGLGFDKHTGGRSIYDALINETPVSEVIRQTKYENLFLCPSSMDLAGAEIEMVALEYREYLLKDALRAIKNAYDFIFIDCPPSLSLITLNAMTAADSVLIPLQCEFFALEGLSQITKTIRQVKKGLNPALELEGVALTMHDIRTNLSVQVAEEVVKYFPGKVFKSAIPRNVRLSEAPSFGEPIIYYDKYSKGANAYFELADEFLKKNGG